MPTLSYPKKWTPPRQQTLQYTPPGGVFDPDTGAPVESFGPSIEPWQMKPALGPGGMYDRFGRRSGAFNFGSSVNDPGTVWNLTGGTAPPPNPPYVSNPQPQPGGTPFGERPGPIGLPNPAGDLAAQYPNLAAANAGVSRNIASELDGQLSPETENALWDTANRFGVSSGMPGAGLWSNKFMGNVAGAIEARKAAGLQHYNQTIPTISGTQTVRPETQISLAEQNSINAAAPNPAAQSSYAEELFNKYLNQIKGVNPAGGTMSFDAPRSYAPPPGFGAPSGPFAPVTAFGGGGRQTWQNLPWQGDNSFASEIDWSGKRGWLNR